MTLLHIKHFKKTSQRNAKMVSGIDLSNLDRDTSPRENFYRFANGGWIDRNPIPAEYSRWGAFEELNELSNAQLRNILDSCRDAILNDGSTVDAHVVAIGTLYATGLDEDAANKHGFNPLQDVFAAIDAVETPAQVAVLKARMSADMGVDGGLFAFYSIPDAKNSAWEVATISQSAALGIGDRDFYVLPDKESVRDAYVVHLQQMLEMSGASCSEVDAQDILALETSLAEVMLTRTERRNPLKVYNKFEGTADFATRTNTKELIPWKDVFAAFGLPDDFGVLIVDHPPYFTHLAETLHSTPLSTWKRYLRYHALLSMAHCLGTDSEQECFDFHSKLMTGQKEMKPRWKRVLNKSVGELLEDSLGMKYTEKHFTPATKEMCNDMVNILKEVLAKHLKGVDWMAEKTKERALLKLSRFRAMIGYPNKWDEEGIEELAAQLSVKKSFADNVRLCSVRMFGKSMGRINKAVDPDRWEMPSYMVNAYYHPLKNVIVFPAAILQPPFLIHPTHNAPDGDPAVNYSAIGAVICHEITHGYDDQGRRFDERGELVDWWTATDAEEYERRADRMIKLCETFEVHGKTLNGKLCLGENIADFGGVRIAFEGLQQYQQTRGRLSNIDGFTPEQRFFLGWASVWRNNIHKENALKRVIMDPHAPGEFRANVVQILDEFHSAFDVREGDKMWAPTELRCDIW